MPRSGSAAATAKAVPASCLFLDCQDEELSPSQTAAYENARTNYLRVLKQIDDYQSMNASISIQHPDGSQGPMVRNIQPLGKKSSGSARGATSGGGRAAAASKRSPPIDVDYSAPTTKRNRRSAAMAARKTISTIATNG